jgi:SAM-dependent methyltransferase
MLARRTSVKVSGTPNFCFLRDQLPISQAAFKKSVSLREQLRGAIADRARYVTVNGLEPSIHLPGANWEPGSDKPLFEGLFQIVMDGDYSIINALRLFSFSYTGFQLLTQKHTPDLPDQLKVLARGVPIDADEQLARLAVDPEIPSKFYIQSYLEATRHLPDLLHVSPPRMFGEVGWLVNGKIVSHDTLAYLERLALLSYSGKLWELIHRKSFASPGSFSGRPRILEIGSGYGGLAYYLKTLIPGARYFCVDLPESLLFSSIYLSTLFPNDNNVLVTQQNIGDLAKDGSGFTFVPNYLFDACVARGLEFDLVINTLSMSEMLEKQVRYYCRGIAKLLGSRGVFFEQNQNNKAIGFINASEIIAEYLPYRLPLSCAFRPLTQGQPHLWATKPISPYQWEKPAQL